ncbi:MAG: hypothetical protein ABIL76_06050 [candidate division WOR-3 bacterium]
MTLQEIINQTNDYIAHYTTGGSIELEQKIRAINRAIEYIESKLGLPSNERVFDFDLITGKNYYDLPTDFREPIDLVFADDAKNTKDNEFEYVPASEIIKKLGHITLVNRFSITYFNGKKQILVFSKETGVKFLIESFRYLTGLTAENDLTNLSIDNIDNVVAFDIDTTASSQTFGALKKTPIASFNLSSQIRRGNLFFRSNIFLASKEFTSINLRFGSSATDYWEMLTDKDINGNPFSALKWNEILWDFRQATKTGNPDPTSITFFSIIFHENANFTTSTGFKIRDLYLEEPIPMKLIYYSLIKGTNFDGTQNKIFLDETNDIVGFGNFTPELIHPVALEAATYLVPQLRKDQQYWSLYDVKAKEILNEIGKMYPRKRRINYGSIKFGR